MTSVGKILVVLQVVLSLLFMGFAGAVFTAQTSWKAESKKHQDNAAKTTNQLRQTEELAQKDKADLTGQLKEQTDKAAASEALATGLKEKNAALEQQLAASRTEFENAQALAKIAGEEARARRDEAGSLRAANDSLHKSRNELIDQVRDLSDRVFNSDLAQKAMNEKQKEALEETAIMKSMFRKQGLSLDPKEYEKMQSPPPLVQGQVAETRKNPRNGGSDLIQITVGSDDGLAKGHELYVYSAGDRPKYLGKIRVEYLEPDMAVGIILEKAKNGVIQKGDNVTSKL
ncbi:MAG: hypothetical protein AB7O26_09565 [Planctomycetaceae bacterium]